jgi:lysophospholipase L1-like esterase
MRLIYGFLVLCGLLGCGRSPYASPPPEVQDPGPLIAAIGDSIVAGHPGADGRLELHDLDAPNQASQAAYWIASITNLPCYNQGISGQTTAQVLERWGRDVLDDGSSSCTWPYHSASLPGPASVIWLHVGSNDIAQGVPLTTTQANLSVMIASAQAHHIPLYLDTIGLLNPDPGSAALSAWITTQAGPGVTVMDYAKFFAGQAGWFSSDETHPSPAGYTAWGIFVGQHIKGDGL